MMLTKDKLMSAGISQYGVITPSEIEFDEEVRRICENNTCGQYGRTWACPPAVGTVQQCKERCSRYSSAMVFSAVYQMADSFDYQAMMDGHREFKDVCDRLLELVKEEGKEILILSNEGCIRCKTCSYPDAPCRKPQRLMPSLEGFGINVMKLAEKAGLSYNGGKNTVTYFGMMLY